VVNAGDGADEHPTQALLDAYMMLGRRGRLAGLTVAIVGDVLHSRVARSKVLLPHTLGADVNRSGRPPAAGRVDAWPVKTTHDLNRCCPPPPW
jgi:aspartate carbamoyltransferase catalytic subunit